MLNFLNNDFFPDDILKPLCNYMRNPKASTFSDLELSFALSKYDKHYLKITELNEGDEFYLKNGKHFVKGKKLRKKYKCKEVNENRYYVISPLASVIRAKK